MLNNYVSHFSYAIAFCNFFSPSQAVATSPIGGDFLTECLLKSLESKGITVSLFHFIWFSLILWIILW